ncbi:hypothetical protein QQM79_06345 [Marinobacteraceae bacterium S3BR75-40.1]
MNRKPDVIRAMVITFVIGLAISGLTSLQDKHTDQAADSLPIISLDDTIAAWEKPADQ